MNTQTSDPTMPFDDLERAYETLAHAIDRAGPAHEALFLTRLALVFAHRTGRLDAFEQAVAVALDDMGCGRIAVPREAAGAIGKATG